MTNPSRGIRRVLYTAPALLLIASPAFAHPGHGPMTGFAAGVMHPLSGIDHLLAMFAVGLWAGVAGGKRVWLWPATFVAAMLVGGALGMAGLHFPTPEPMILASVIVLGAAIACGMNASLPVGTGMIALFGLAHGYAHGVEMPANVGGLDFAAGFTLSTMALHASGIGAAFGLNRIERSTLVRIAGAAISLAGVGLIFGG